MNEEEIIKALNQFIGTTKYYPSDFRRLNFTEGIWWMAENLGAHWLLSIVESVQQIPKVKGNNSFIVWLIQVNEDKSWKVTGWTDTPYDSEMVYEQKGNYTDFGLNDFSFYQEGDVLLLKNEH